MADILVKKRRLNLPGAIILPVVLSVFLFFMTIFFSVLPRLESALMAQRRGLLHALTETVWSTLRHYHERQLDGELTREAAQAKAKAHVRGLRYGPESKDYFWINDMTPVMVMHPYRPDLEGKDITHFADPSGKRLFREVVRVVREKGSGFVDYQWQWMDDPGRIVPKISFVKEFSPWGWVVGTGIYIGDIQTEIFLITRNLTVICTGILALVSLLSGVIIWQGVKVEKKRLRAEERAQLQKEQLYQAGKMATVGTLAAGVAHEINNPVTAILLNAPILRSLWERAGSGHAHRDKTADTEAPFEAPDADLDALYARVPQLLDDIEESAVRIKNIVNELKDFARISPPEMHDGVSLNAAAEKAAVLVMTLIKKSMDHFSMTLQPDLPGFRGNPQKVEQVIVNLLVNACQALENKSQTIRIETGLDPGKKTVTISVKDTGVGIAPEVLKRIKDPFFTTRQSSGNTGLGLAISDKIIKDHGGTLSFETTGGRETIATVSFPISEKTSMKEPP